MLFRIAAVLCFLAVALGAFGAHSLRSTLEARGMLDAYGDDATSWGAAKVVGDERGSYEVLLPGDPGYDSATSRTENSWVRIPARAGSGD